MRKVVVAMVIAGGLLGSAHAATAVNCDQVRRYLSTGRSEEDVADTMIISVDEVKKCKAAGADQQNAPKADPTPANAGKSGGH